jgi:hypothetical protein
VYVEYFAGVTVVDEVYISVPGVPHSTFARKADRYWL